MRERLWFVGRMQVVTVCRQPARQREAPGLRWIDAGPARVSRLLGECHPWCVEHGQDGDRTALPGVAPGEDEDGVVTRLEVAGHVFDLRADEFGGTHYTWVSGPNPGYGFSVSPTRDELEEHRANILGFLAMINPMTGFIAED